MPTRSSALGTLTDENVEHRGVENRRRNEPQENVDQRVAPASAPVTADHPAGP
jgi:hypothetical protein